jgi:DnaJ-domain-containing protein 1
MEEREPFSGLERALGDILHQVVVVDEGTVEGMWRDPVGDLADALFPGAREEAYAAASGYVLLRGRAVLAVVRKRGSWSEDAWFLQEALSRADRRVPTPDPKRRPRGSSSKGTREKASRQKVSAEPAGPAAPQPADAWRLLGVTPRMSLAEARKTFRALVAQYHPDKVAHLAPEFRQLAEERTRQILDAWEEVSRALRDC